MSNPDPRLVPRPACPTCGDDRRRPLVDVPARTFAYCNPTIDVDRLEASGLLDVPAIGLARCDRCETVATTHVLDDACSQTLWGTVVSDDRSREKIYSFKKISRNAGRWAKAVAALKRSPSDHDPIRVFDFGCGWGDFLSAADAPGVKCFGLEINAAKIEYARGRGLEIVQRIDQLPEGFRFDVLHCDQVLEHVPNPADILASLRRLAAPGAVAYLSVPNYPTERIDRAVRAIRDGEPFEDKDLITWDHLNYFNGRAFGRLLSDAGWTGVTDPATVDTHGGRTSTWAIESERVDVRRDDPRRPGPRRTWRGRLSGMLRSASRNDQRAA